MPTPPTGRYLSVTSFRRDGTGVATPVWFVPDDQDRRRLLVETDAGSHKLRRIRRTPLVTIAPCTATGRLRGTPVPAWAELLPDGELARVDRLMARKYCRDLAVIKPLRALSAALRGRPARGTPVVLAITLEPDREPAAAGRRRPGPAARRPG